MEIFKTNKDINDIKIAILADIHYYPKYSKKILNKIKMQILDNKPNYLVIAGDILDKSNYDYTYLLKLLKELANSIKIIIVLGNHDIYYKKKGIIYEEINYNFIQELDKTKNIILLRDEKYIDNNICFYGFDLNYNYYYKTKEKYEVFANQVSKLKTKLDDKYYNITIFHSPVNIYEFINKNPESNLAKSDLIISGHMHNGCLPYWVTNIFNKIFKTNKSLISPNKRFFPDYSQGRVYKIRDGIIYEGLSKLSKSANFLHYFDFIYHKKVTFITINKI